MGIESSLRVREPAVWARHEWRGGRAGAAVSSVELALEASEWTAFCVDETHRTGVRTHVRVGVPKHAVASRLDDGYELSTRVFRSTDLRRIC